MVDEVICNKGFIPQDCIFAKVNKKGSFHQLFPANQIAKRGQPGAEWLDHRNPVRKGSEVTSYHSVNGSVSVRFSPSGSE